MAFTTEPTPTPGHFYRAKTGDTWLGIVGRAYGVRSGGTRLKFSKMANWHPFNWRLHRNARNSFERKHYDGRLVSLARRFPCDEPAYQADAWLPLARGKCRPLIFIPPATDIWYPPPPEIVQSDRKMCWAAALTSLTLSRNLAHAFPDQESLIKRFRSIKIKHSGGETPIVPPKKSGLRYLPVKAQKAQDPAPPLVRGEATITMVARFLDLEQENYFGSARPSKIQKARDRKIEMRDLEAHLREAGGPIVLFQQLPPKKRSAGHVIVVFGASGMNGLFMAMDPFPFSATGDIFGVDETIVLRSTKDLTRTVSGKRVREIYILW